jgi:transcriptional regulator with XRE-family HTH domain
MDIARQLQRARLNLNLTRAELAALAGMATSTISRIERGEISPSLETVEKIATAAGREMTIELPRGCNQVAIAAGRTAMAGDDFSDLPGVQDLLDRWRLAGLVGDAGQAVSNRRIAELSGKLARLRQRPGLRTVRSNALWFEVGRKLSESGVAWCNTGDSAANRISLSADQIWPVFYVADIDAAIRVVGIDDNVVGSAPRVSFLPFDRVAEVGRWEGEDGLWFADIAQVMIDCYGGTGRMPQQAEALADVLESRAQASAVA